MIISYSLSGRVLPSGRTKISDVSSSPLYVSPQALFHVEGSTSADETNISFARTEGISLVLRYSFI
jgi:hypothetical protein